MKMSDVETEKLLWLSCCHRELMNAANFEPMKLDVPLLREIASSVQSNDLGPLDVKEKQVRRLKILTIHTCRELTQNLQTTKIGFLG